MIITCTNLQKCKETRGEARPQFNPIPFPNSCILISVLCLQLLKLAVVMFSGGLCMENIIGFREVYSLFVMCHSTSPYHCHCTANVKQMPIYYGR